MSWGASIFVEELVDLVARRTARRPGVVPSHAWTMPSLGEHAVDGEALGGLDVLVLVGDLLAVVVTDVGDGERRLVDERHDAVDALDDAGDVLRAAQRAPHASAGIARPP